MPGEDEAMFLGVGEAPPPPQMLIARGEARILGFRAQAWWRAHKPPVAATQSQQPLPVILQRRETLAHGLNTETHLFSTYLRSRHTDGARAPLSLIPRI